MPRVLPPLAKPLVMLGTGLASAAVLAAAGTGTFAVFTASITDNGRSSTYGTLVMTLESESGKCVSTSDGPRNAATCDDVQEFGGRTDLVPGSVVESKVRVTNTGTLPAGSLTLQSGQCDVMSTLALKDYAEKVREVLCRKTSILIAGEDGEAFRGAPAELADRGAVELRPLKPGQSETVYFRAEMPDIDDNIFQGTGFSLPLTWTFTGSDGG